MDEATLEEIRKLRLEFIALLEDVFDGKHREGNKFGRYQQQEVAKYTGITTLTRLLNDPDKSEEPPKKVDAYRSAIKKVKAAKYFKAHLLEEGNFPREPESEQGVPQYWRLGCFVLLGLSIIMAIYLGIKKTDKISAIYTEKQFTALFDLAGKENSKEISEMAVTLNRENMKLMKRNHRNSLTRDEKIDCIQRAKEKVRNILKANRDRIASLEFMVNGQKNVDTFAHFIIHLDSLFIMSNSEIVDYQTGSELPEKIKDSFYDQALLSVRNYLFEEKDAMTIIQELTDVTQHARDRFETQNVELFHCYLKYGEECFERERFFNCYLEHKTLSCP